MRALLPVLAVFALQTANADPLRDPTRPPQAPGARAGRQEAPPTLTAVFAAGQRRSAIFNGHLVRAGDAVGAYEIQDVLVDGVRYRHGGAMHDLHLPRPPDSIKKPTTASPRGSEGP
jgi:hypothetical protein